MCYLVHTQARIMLVLGVSIIVHCKWRGIVDAFPAHTALIVPALHIFAISFLIKRGNRPLDLYVA